MMMMMMMVMMMMVVVVMVVYDDDDDDDGGDDGDDDDDVNGRKYNSPPHIYDNPIQTSIIAISYKLLTNSSPCTLLQYSAVQDR